MPQTDDDVFALFERDYSEVGVKLLLAKIYKCRRGMGDSVTDALKYALKAHVEAGQ